MTQSFTDGFAQLNAVMQSVGVPAELPKDAVVGVVTTATSMDGSISVQVCDGQLTSITVDPSAHLEAQMLPTMMETINDALARNQVAVLAELKRVSPSYAALFRVVDETVGNARTAMERTLGAGRE